MVANLSDLPTSDKEQTPEETDVMQKYFDTPSSSSGGGMRWRSIAYTTLLFVIVANPWIDMLLCKIPYCGNATVLFAIKVLIFLVVLVCLNFFLG